MLQRALSVKRQGSVILVVNRILAVVAFLFYALTIDGVVGTGEDN
jgi:hypothetical protein